MKSDRAASRKGVSTFFVVLPVILALVPVFLTLQAGDPLSFMLPNFLLFTNLRSLARSQWESLLKLNTAVHHTPHHVPIVSAEQYSYESLREATENFRYPAVVRGLFSNTPAARKWGEPGYLSSIIGNFSIPVINNSKIGKANATAQEGRTLMKFGDAYEEILSNRESTLYLFFPVQSRFSYNHSEAGALEALTEKVNQLVIDDLQIDKVIWNGFGTEVHKNYYGSQFIAGNGLQSIDDTTGTGWHCAPGNNWFAQVIGRKRWYFLDPKYSSYMYPLRGGKVNMMTGNMDMRNMQNHLPIRIADLEAGDLLFNPSWEWHSIRNHQGLSFGVPIRELNFTQSLRNNFQYTSIILINKVLEKFGLDIGGYN